MFMSIFRFPSQTSLFYFLGSLFFVLTKISLRDLVQVELPPDSSPLSLPQLLAPVSVPLCVWRLHQELVEGVRPSSFVILATLAGTRWSVPRVRFLSCRSGSSFFRWSGQDDCRVSGLWSFALSSAPDLLNHEWDRNERGLRCRVPALIFTSLQILLTISRPFFGMVAKFETTQSDTYFRIFIWSWQYLVNL